MPSLRDEITKTFLRLRGKDSSGGHSSSGVDSPETPPLPEGADLGPYKVLKQLGSGGMGHVYLALDTHLNRKVALKLLPSALTGNPISLRRFEQEARTASALNHPNILTILGFPEISGRHVLVSEYIEGQTLRAALHRRLDLPFALDVISQVVSALAAAHAAGVIHRDLKPTNIMIRPDGYVKVIDFGLAKLTQRKSDAPAGQESWTLPGAVLGTVGYMSPEQARGDEIDARSDIWSIGVILYEMVARCRPFEGSTDSHVIVAILDDPPRPIPQDEKLPAGVVSIIHRALAKDKKARYQTAQQLWEDLQRVQEEMGARGRRPRFTAPARRLPYLAILAAAAILLAACSIWWWPLGGRWKVLAPSWFEIAASRRLTFLGNVTLAAISPDGKQLAFVAGSSGSESFRILDLKSNAERQLPATPDHYLGLTFSPDSKTLFYVIKNMQQERGRLFSIPVAGIGSEPPSVMLEDLEGPIALSAAGDRFAFVRGRAEAGQDLNQIFTAFDSNPRNVTPIVSLYGTEIANRLAWSPKNLWLAGVEYPSRLHEATKGIVFLYGLDGRPLKTFSPASFRRLRDPVALDGGSLLVFAGMPQGGEQNRLAQLFTPTGEFHQGGSSILGFESLSVTADSKSLAAVQFDERSSIWTASADDLQNPTKLTPDSEKISSLDWLGEDTIVFPSARTGNVNLVTLRQDGRIDPLAAPESCVHNDPAALPGGSGLVYASNCAGGGDDFNLWLVGKNRKPQRLTSGSNFDYQPNISPDGKWIYYTSWSSNIPSIWKVPSAGGLPTRVMQSQGETPILSPDGTKFVATVREGDHGGWMVTIVSTLDGSVVQRLPRMPIQRPIRWSPDGKALDYVNEDRQSCGIWRQPVPNGSPKLLLRIAEGTIPSFAWNRSGTKLALIRARDQKDAFLFTRAARN